VSLANTIQGRAGKTSALAFAGTGIAFDNQKEKQDKEKIC